MRDLLTILACALIVVLTAALVGPYLVDWTAQRALVEARLSQILGAPVHVAGPISLTLLPTPSLSVGDVTIDPAAPGQPSLTAARVDFELAVAPLMRGEIQVMRADLDRPILRVSLRPDGGFVLPSAPTDLPARIEIDELRLRDATLLVARGGGRAPWRLTQLDLQAQATSLAGPFSGAGSVGEGAGKVKFSFAAGTRRGNSMSLQASVAATPRSPAVSFDGALLLASDGVATKATLRGSASSAGVVAFRGFAPVSWTFAGALRVGAAGLSVDKGDLRIGPDARNIEANVSGRAGFASGAPIEAAFAAQDVDLDRFLGNLGPEAGRRLIRAVATALSDSSLFDSSPRPLRLTFAAPALTIGGQTLTGTRLGLDARAGSPARVSLEGQGPGGAHLAWRGALETGPAAVLRGRLDFGAQETGRFADWLAPAFPEAAARLKSAPVQTLDFKGDVDISAVGFSARNVVLTADRTVLRGAAAYTEAIGSQRARLFADLRSDALDLDALPNLSGPAQATRDTDLALSLDARAVRLAHFGQGMVDAGRIVLSLRRTGQDLRLDTLSLANLGGADLSATGEADEKGAQLDISLDADRLDELAAVVSRVAPGPFADALAARAVALSPARLALHVKAVRQSDGTYRPVSLSLRGSARDSQASGALTPDPTDPKTVDLEFDLHGPDAAVLLRQLGFDALPLVDAGAGQIEVRAQSRPAGDLSTTVAASIAGADFSFVGRVANWMNAPSAQGKATLTSDDAEPFLRLMTIVLPDSTSALPLSLAAEMSAKPGALSLTDLSGLVAGDRVAGSAVLDTSDAAGPQLSGALSLDRLSFANLASLALGPIAPASSGALWSLARFAPGLAEPPSSDLQIAAKTFDLAPDWSAADASFDLRLAAGLVGLRNLKMKIGGGAVTGGIDLRRDGPTASLTAELAATGIRIDHPYFSGLVSGKADFAATGESALDLATGLAGSGSLAVARVRVARTAPDALTRILAASEDSNFDVEAPSVESALAKDLDGGRLDLGSRAFDLEAAGGVLRLTSPSPGPTNVAAVRGALDLSFDLRSLGVEERAVLTSAATPKDWPETTPPRVSVLWRTPRPNVAADQTIDADGLIADFATRAAAREAARIAALNADVQERAFFERRMEGLSFMRQREKEDEAWKADQARRAKAAAKPIAPARPIAAPPLASIPPPAPPQPPAGLGEDPLSLGRF